MESTSWWGPASSVDIELSSVPTYRLFMPGRRCHVLFKPSRAHRIMPPVAAFDADGYLRTGIVFLRDHNNPAREVAWCRAWVKDCPYRCGSWHCFHWKLSGLRAEIRDVPCCHDVFILRPLLRPEPFSTTDANDPFWNMSRSVREVVA